MFEVGAAGDVGFDFGESNLHVSKYESEKRAPHSTFDVVLRILRTQDYSVHHPFEQLPELHDLRG